MAVIYIQSKRTMITQTRKEILVIYYNVRHHHKCSFASLSDQETSKAIHHSTQYLAKLPARI